MHLFLFLILVCPQVRDKLIDFFLQVVPKQGPDYEKSAWSKGVVSQRMGVPQKRGHSWQRKKEHEYTWKAFSAMVMGQNLSTEGQHCTLYWKVCCTNLALKLVPNYFLVGCYKMLSHNPWYPKTGTFNEDSWDWVGEGLEHACSPGLCYVP